MVSTNGHFNCFCFFVFDCYLSQHVLEPTHVKGNVLNLVLTFVSVVDNYLTVHPPSVASFLNILLSVLISFVTFHLHVNPNLVMLLISLKLTMREFPLFLLDSNFSVTFDSSDIGS